MNLQTPDISDDIAALARQCMKEADNDRIKAAELLYPRLNEDQKAKVLNAYLDRALRALVTQVVGSTRAHTTFSGPREEEQSIEPRELAPPDPGAGLIRLARRNLDAALDNFKLSTGAALGDASKVQLLEEAASEHGAARIHMERSLFLQEIANRVGSAAKVRLVLNNNDIKQIAKHVNEEVWS